MEDYKQRMIEEYQQTKARYQKLHKMLVKKDAGTAAKWESADVVLPDD